MDIQAALHHPQAIRFAGNQIYKDKWESSGGQVAEQSTGHLVFYNQQDQRVLMTDPGGNPLHECLWTAHPTGSPELVSARIRLDWNQWVGIKPQGIVNTISLDLSQRPGWERLTRDDLRQMVARSMNVDLETIQFFYGDSDLTLHGDGLATIRQVKDAFYILPDGTFDHAKFMSCMSRIQWGRIDYLPVVELFLSLLPGTGSATFELIRGLYDDQNPQIPLPLHYRGIPVYPSEGAFRLFSVFFTPSTQTGESPQEVFLDPARSQEVQWNPAPHYPVRFFDESRRIGVTVHHHHVQKVTHWDDATGLSFFPVLPSGEGFADGRGVHVFNQELYLNDGTQLNVFPIRESWQISSNEKRVAWKPSPSSWRNCFPLGSPAISPSEAFSAVLLYPDQSASIGEMESQPFVFDFFDDFLEEQPDLLRQRSHAGRVLLACCDAGLGASLKFDRPQSHTIWYTWPEFAQKQAQTIWNRLNRRNQLPWLPNFQLFPFHEDMLSVKQSSFDFIYLWIPFSDYSPHTQIERWITLLARSLSPGGIGFVAGPPILREGFLRQGLQVLHEEEGESLPTFRIHQTTLPYGFLNPALLVWIVQQS